MIEFYMLANDFSNLSFDSLLELQSVCIKQVNKLITAIDSNCFIYDDYSLKRDSQSNLTNKKGIYALVDRNSKKIYVGGTINLAGRKANYNFDLFNQSRYHKLSPEIRKVIVDNPVRAADFYFVPLVIVEAKNQNELVTHHQIVVLDKIEEKVLENFLSSSKKERFYNLKTTNKFQKNNSYGGSAKSGRPNKPIRFQNYALESVSAAAKHLQWDRKTIRNFIARGILKDLTFDEWQNFLDSTRNGVQFFNSDPSLNDTVIRDKIKQDIKNASRNQKSDRNL